MRREPGQRERRLDSGPRWLLLVMERVCVHIVCFFGCTLIPSLPRTAAAVKLGPGGIPHRHRSPLPGVHTAGQQPQSLDQRAQVCGATSTWTRLNAHTHTVSRSFPLIFPSSQNSHAPLMCHMDTRAGGYS